MFLYNVAMTVMAELTFTANILSLKTSLTFRMGPYEPLAMKPRICEHRRTVISVFLLFFLTLLNSWGAEYLEMVSSRESTMWELRQKDRDESGKSSLFVWRLSRVLWRQQYFRRSALRSDRLTKYSWVSMSDRGPIVWREPMTESTLSRGSLSLDDKR